jgi:hypothetical protein
MLKWAGDGSLEFAERNNRRKEAKRLTLVFLKPDLMFYDDDTVWRAPDQIPWNLHSHENLKCRFVEETRKQQPRPTPNGHLSQQVSDTEHIQCDLDRSRGENRP